MKVFLLEGISLLEAMEEALWGLCVFADVFRDDVDGVFIAGMGLP